MRLPEGLIIDPEKRYLVQRARGGNISYEGRDLLRAIGENSEELDGGIINELVRLGTYHIIRDGRFEPAKNYVNFIKQPRSS